MRDKEKTMSSQDINRRRFLMAGALGLAGAPLLQSCGGEKSTPVTGTADAAGAADTGPRIRKYNTLGRTGLQVSDISLGGATEEPVLRYALDRGINLYDTAEQYHSGEHERYIGQAFKGSLRDKVVVITKHVHGLEAPITRQNVIERFDASLERMGYDYVDIAMLHHVADPATFENEELLGAYEALRQQGKFRFLGFSTHDAEKVIPGAIDSGLFDVMLMIYNSIQYPQRSELITRARQAGIGTMAMKTMAGRQQDRVAGLVNEKTTFSQAAIKWALSDPSLDSVLISIRTFEHVDEYCGASGRTLTSADEAVLGKYETAVNNQFCRIGCTTCQASCPEQVAVGDIMRFGMYYENYGNEKQAILEYAALNGRNRASACLTCRSGACETACPHNLSIRERLVRYDGMLRV